MTYCPRCATPLVDKAEENVQNARVRRVCPREGCGYVFYDNPLPVAAAIVEHEGEIVLVRAHAWPEHWFGLVTGFIERGEGADEAALREVREELGLDAEIVSLVGVYPFAQRNELIVAYHVRARGQVVVGAELAGIKRVAPDRLRPWPFGTGHAVRDWLARRAPAS